MSKDSRKIAFIFPGQGAQYVGMGKDFFETHTIAKETFQEGDEVLQQSISNLAFEGPVETLTQTKNNQVAIYLNSIAILRVIQKEFPQLTPQVCAGLSLGEYSALTAANKLSFQDTLPVVQARGQFMHEACESTKGTMAAILGLSAEDVESMVEEANLPNDLWVANFNCPGQTVISGTEKGVAAGIEAAKARGAKRAMPLQVHGAFHSGLMQEAQNRLESTVNSASLNESETEFVMNVPGNYVTSPEEMKRNLTLQVTHSVRWEQSIRAMTEKGVSLFVEIGCGKSLAAMNKRSAPGTKTVSVDKLSDLESLNDVLEVSHV